VAGMAGILRKDGALPSQPFVAAPASVAAIFTPPNFHITILAAVAFWLSCELAIYTRHRTLALGN
jgi:hypothetical protein